MQSFLWSLEHFYLISCMSECFEDGELYLWGKNANVQLGLGKNAEKIIPHACKVQCLDGVNIKTISLGFEHSFAITDNGEALSWGGGESGKLGHGHELSILGFQKSSSEFTPCLIKSLEGVQVKSVATGMMHSACISENGAVFVFVEREFGKWGFGKAKNVTTPSTVSTLPFSKEVACGAYHTCVITNGGELYSWGSNENGCLGIGCTNITYSPERVQGPLLGQPVTKISCGWKRQLFLKVMFTLGAGVVPTEHFKKMGFPQEDSWVKMMTSITLNQC